MRNLLAIALNLHLAATAFAGDFTIDDKTKAFLQTQVERTHRGAGSISGDKADAMSALISYFRVLGQHSPGKAQKVDLCLVVAEKITYRPTPDIPEIAKFTYCTDTMVTQAYGVESLLLKESPRQVIELSSLIQDNFPHNGTVDRVGIMKAQAYLNLGEKRKAADTYLAIADKLLAGPVSPEGCKSYDLKTALTGAGDILENSQEVQPRFAKFIDSCKDQEIQVRRDLAAIVSSIGKEAAALYVQARQDRGQNYYGYDQERHSKTTDALFALIPKIRDRSWQSYLTFIVAERYFRNPTQYQVPGAREQSIAEYTKITTDFPDEVFPIDDPAFGVQKGVKIAPYAYMKLSFVFESRVVGVTASPQKDLAAKQYETILEKYHDPSLLDGSGAIIGSAMASLLRIYGQSEKGRDLAKKFALEYPNMPFLWNGWWFGQTRPEALLYLAQGEKDRTIKSGYLMQVIEDYSDVWTGKAGSDDVSLYSGAAIGDLTNLCETDEELSAYFERVHQSKAGAVAKALALQTLAQIRESARDAAGAVALYQELVSTYPTASYGYEEEPFSKNAAVRIKALQQTPPQFIDRKPKAPPPPPSYLERLAQSPFPTVHLRPETSGSLQGGYRWPRECGRQAYPSFYQIRVADLARAQDSVSKLFNQSHAVELKKGCSTVGQWTGGFGSGDAVVHIDRWIPTSGFGDFEKQVLKLGTLQAAWRLDMVPGIEQAILQKQRDMHSQQSSAKTSEERQKLTAEAQRVDAEAKLFSETEPLEVFHLTLVGPKK